MSYQIARTAMKLHDQLISDVNFYDEQLGPVPASFYEATWVHMLLTVASAYNVTSDAVEEEIRSYMNERD